METGKTKKHGKSKADDDKSGAAEKRPTFKLVIPSADKMTPEAVAAAVRKAMENVLRQPFNIRNMKTPLSKMKVSNGRLFARKEYMTTPPLLINMALSYMSPRGNFDPDGETKQQYPPADLNSTAYKIFIVPPRKTSTDPLRMEYQAGFDELRLWIQKHDEAFVEALCDKANVLTYTGGRDHPLVEALNQEKRAHSYDPVRRAEEFLRKMHEGRRKTDQVPQPKSSYCATLKTDVVDGVLVTELLEGIDMSRKVFKPLSAAEKLDVKGKPTVDPYANWPDIFRGRTFYKPATDEKLAYEAPSVENRRYEHLEITDCFGLTPEQFNARLPEDSQVPLRDLLRVYKGVLPASVGFEFQMVKTAEKAVIAPAMLADVKLLLPWGVFIAFTRRQPQVREKLDIDEASVDPAFSFLFEHMEEADKVDPLEGSVDEPEGVAKGESMPVTESDSEGGEIEVGEGGFHPEPVVMQHGGDACDAEEERTPPSSKRQADTVEDEEDVPPAPRRKARKI